MIQYFTYRLLPTSDGWLKPDIMLINGFAELPFNYELEIAKIPSKDGRILGYIEADTQEIIDVVIEGLAAWSAHPKTLTTASDYYYKCKKKLPEVKDGKIITAVKPPDDSNIIDNIQVINVEKG